mmetsp:Transcript_16870/g.64029  ORF Transcript_16870/g.64029 Transcript_16870/m.64029 type:complete len:202 (+) Transcript_16870:1389-1994(+)
MQDSLVESEAGPDSDWDCGIEDLGAFFNPRNTQDIPSDVREGSFTPKVPDRASFVEVVSSPPNGDWTTPTSTALSGASLRNLASPALPCMPATFNENEPCATTMRFRSSRRAKFSPGCLADASVRLPSAVSSVMDEYRLLKSVCGTTMHCPNVPLMFVCAAESPLRPMSRYGELSFGKFASVAPILFMTPNRVFDEAEPPR